MKLQYVWKILTLLLLIFVIILANHNRQLSKEKAELTTQLARYQEMSGQSYVVERISKQMEDIAYQQKNISDNQREEALAQMHIAENMRARALSEQRKAEEYARNASEAKTMAENQREIAIKQQYQAEYSKRVTDTLSYIALGRSMAWLSITQFNSGNKDLAAKLAYLSWKFTSLYKGNQYFNSIYNALSLNSGSLLQINLHKGGISQIIPLDASHRQYISASRYGEIRKWNYSNDKLQNELLYSDSNLSFRALAVGPDQTISALSFDGTLILFPPNSHLPKVINLGSAFQKGIKIFSIDSNQLLLAFENGLVIVDQSTYKVVKEIPLPHGITTIERKDDEWIIFGKNNHEWTLNKQFELKPTDRWIKEKVTAYKWSSQQRIGAAGTNDGTIYLIDQYGNIIRKLIGHQSQITQLAFNGKYLYSSSFDRTLSLWDYQSPSQESVTLHTSPSWIYTFSFGPNDVLWIGDEMGNLSRLVISPSKMASQILNKLTKDFTEEEWDFYVGKNIPQIQLLNTK